MRWLLVSTLVGLLVVSPGAAQAPSATDQTVLKLDRELIDALFKKDRTTFEPLLADDYVYIHSNGTVASREEEIAQTMASDVKWTASKLSGLVANLQSCRPSKSRE